MAEEATASTTSSSTPKTSNTAPQPPPQPPSQPHQDTTHNDHDATQTTQEEAEDDDDMLLVTEFPPPPHYYALASRHTPAHLRLIPPEIPLRSFRVAAKKVMAERKRAKEESERMRWMACAGKAGAEEGAVGGGGGGGDDGTKLASQDNVDDDSIDPDDPNEPVVAVFGEIVEDPTLTVEEECDDPTVIRENVKRLNQEVLRGFLTLVRVLVNDPNENKKLRDELSHNLFLMLQECNKFREHQAREILITTLEQQLVQREQGLALLKRQIAEAEDSLVALSQFCER